MDTNTVAINGTETAAPQGAIAYKYNDPTEDARWIYDEGEADQIAAEDPSLIEWVGEPSPLTVTAEDVEALYRRGQEIGGEATLVVNDRRGTIEVHTLTAAKDFGYPVICDYGNLLALDHSGCDPDAWDAEMFRLAAMQLTEHNPL